MPVRWLTVAVLGIALQACNPSPDTGPKGSAPVERPPSPPPQAATDKWLQYLSVPAAVGSISPNLSATDHGLVVSWLEPAGDARALRYSTFSQNAWEAPVGIAADEGWFVNWADFPSVVPVSGTFWVAHWLDSQPAGGYAYDVRLAISGDAGRNWSEAGMPHDDGTPTEHGFVSIYPTGGGAGLVWLDGRNMVDASGHETGQHGMTLRNAVLTQDAEIRDGSVVDGLVCDCCQTDVAVTAAGPIAIYRNRTDDEIRDIYVSRFRDGTWQPGTPVADDGWQIPGCPVNGPVIQAEGEDLAAAWFTAAEAERRVQLAWSDDDGQSFSAPLEIAHGDAHGRVGLALLDDGVAAVSWICRQPSGGNSMCIRTASRSGVLGPVKTVSGEDRVPTMSVPQLAAFEGYLFAAWTADARGESTIGSARIDPAFLEQDNED